MTKLHQQKSEIDRMSKRSVNNYLIILDEVNKMEKEEMNNAQRKK